MARFFLTVFFGLLFTVISSVLTVRDSHASTENGSVDVAFHSDSNQVVIFINSPQGISAAQIKLNIPTEVTVGDAQIIGFMEGATHLSYKQEHRWFHLKANGGKQTTLAIPLTYSEKNNYYVTLVGVNLKDVAGNNVPISTQFPVAIEIVAPKPVSPPSEKTSPPQAEINPMPEAKNQPIRPGVNESKPLDFISNWTSTNWAILGVILLVVVLLAIPQGLPAFIARQHNKRHPVRSSIANIPPITPLPSPPLYLPAKVITQKLTTQPVSLAPGYQVKTLIEQVPIVRPASYLSIVFPITTEASLGSGESDDIVIKDASVSYKHARIIQINGKYVIEDLASANGTFVSYSGDPEQEKKVTSRNALKDGSYLKLGNTNPIQFHLNPVSLQLTYVLSKEKMTTIGRDSGNNIILNHSSVSPGHAEIHCEEDKFVISNLGSTNGTFIKTNTISSPEHRVEDKGILSHNTIIRIGDIKLYVHLQ